MKKWLAMLGAAMARAMSPASKAQTGLTAATRAGVCTDVKRDASISCVSVTKPNASISRGVARHGGRVVCLAVVIVLALAWIRPPAPDLTALAVPIAINRGCLPVPTVLDPRTTQLAPGLRLTLARLSHVAAPAGTFDPLGRVQIVSTNLDLYRPGVIIAGRWGRGAKLSQMAAKPRLRVAVNGGYFHLGPRSLENTSDGPVLIGSHAYQLLSDRRGHVLAWDAAGRPRATDLSFSGSVTASGVKVRLLALNTDLRTAVGMRVWDAPDSMLLKVRWGATVSGGQVVHVWRNEIPMQPKAGQVVVGTTSATEAKEFAVVKKSSAMRVVWKMNSVDGLEVKAAISVTRIIARGGTIDMPCNDATEVLHPRTVIGWDKRKTHMWLATTQASGTDRDWYGGSTTRQLGQILIAQGADTVVVMDGGGSTELLARGSDRSKLRRYDEPDSAFERSIPTGLGIFAR